MSDPEMDAMFRLQVGDVAYFHYDQDGYYVPGTVCGIDGKIMSFDMHYLDKTSQAPADAPIMKPHRDSQGEIDGWRPDLETGAGGFLPERLP